ncbi:hypothetical protein TSUD_286370 [Trifolium subterraneum]|uniref:Uncharacterized protein n=1 Tax=Trifolium subterraneum TaxID=3900 RepID=A0A2Z6N9T0_TRISU|nr:hypothetical protein TSUD_286370 [Trifolium subterraneum]
MASTSNVRASAPATVNEVSSSVAPVTALYNMSSGTEAKMLAITDGLQEKLLKKIHVDINIEVDNHDADVSDDAKGKRKSQVKLQRNNMYKRGLTQAKQTTINGAYKKGIRDDACEEWIEDVEDEEDEGDDISLDVGQDVSIGDVLGDDLELPPIDEEDDDAVEVEENEDEDGTPLNSGR